MAGRRTILAAVLVAAGCCCAVGLAAQGSRPTEALQGALDDLHHGRLKNAERAALVLASRYEPPVPRAWLVVAAARERRERHASAVDAYEGFLVYCTATRLRRYALRRIALCRAHLSPPAMPTAPSRRLSSRRRTS